MVEERKKKEGTRVRWSNQRTKNEMLDLKNRSLQLDYRYLRLVSKKLEFVHATIYPDFTSIAKEEITWVLPHLMISKFLNTMQCLPICYCKKDGSN